MASGKKFNLSISGGTKDDQSSYRDFTRGYRLSDNVIDRRGPEFESERDEIVIQDLLNHPMNPKPRVEKNPERVPQYAPAMEDYIENSKRK